MVLYFLFQITWPCTLTVLSCAVRSDFKCKLIGIAGNGHRHYINWSSKIAFDSMYTKKHQYDIGLEVAMQWLNFLLLFILDRKVMCCVMQRCCKEIWESEPPVSAKQSHFPLHCSAIDKKKPLPCHIIYIDACIEDDTWFHTILCLCCLWSFFSWTNEFSANDLLIFCVPFLCRSPCHIPLQHVVLLREATQLCASAQATTCKCHHW